VEVELLLGIVGGLLAFWVLFIGLLWIVRPRHVRLGEAVRILPDLLRLVRSLIADGSAPFLVRASLVGLLAWLLNPVDLIPEFIPVLGPLDDVVVAVLVLRYVRRRLGSEELRRRWSGSPAGFDLLSAILGSDGSLT
jgi:uncharacterized membrane protein YkvA (DUF1232 family)